MWHFLVLLILTTSLYYTRVIFIQKIFISFKDNVDTLVFILKKATIPFTNR